MEDKHKTIEFKPGRRSSPGILQQILSKPIGFLGFYLSLASIFLFIVSFGVYHYTTDVRIGVVTFMLIPFMLLAGVALVLLSLWLPHHGDKSTLLGALGIPSSASAWTPAVVRSGFTFAAIGLVAFMLYQAYHYSDRVEFCGVLCHKVMQPEYAAYEGSPHSRISCTSCHIGPGASWFVRAKLSGTRQVFATIFNTYEQPIPTPVHDLRPARETCEECHWPQKFTSDIVKVKRNYGDDEYNSPTNTVLVMRVGGGESGLRKGQGIHWHATSTVEYVADDEARQEMSLVRYRDAQGEMHVYRMDGDEGEVEDATDGLRRMDCIDCHNRPTHIFRSPKESVDQLLAHGAIDIAIPYIKSVGVAAMEQQAATQKEGLRQLEDYVRNYYKENYPEVSAGMSGSLDRAIEALKSEYASAVFPEMNVDYNTYIDNIGHQDWPGCFRCHGSDLEDSDGNTISADCNTCHAILAYEEEGEPHLLELLSGGN